ncbi:hypothetical protein MIND_01195900 [Mycena indigotica]|uniref:Uncharacterized protein n=1 Tax=Mycena indigotica TaxID=2126181 RepID=A0A8H6VT32_9AGAR|nr:uncharacterized protein MIND_01195500 [Mycena indigotica]XP_037215395.1 uncharacterized protein MIND_01195900 [Mycena indigotica]KAF7292963.1 hypothetical protein MIND_01195500 [Mycena indigotica]KAF7292967.1 hypothetical protein MIND_01195900 [Mycena indigotica]
MTTPNIISIDQNRGPSAPEIVDYIHHHLDHNANFPTERQLLRRFMDQRIAQGLLAHSSDPTSNSEEVPFVDTVNTFGLKITIDDFLAGLGYIISLAEPILPPSGDFDWQTEHQIHTNRLAAFANWARIVRETYFNGRPAAAGTRSKATFGTCDEVDYLVVSPCSTTECHWIIKPLQADLGASEQSETNPDVDTDCTNDRHSIPCSTCVFEMGREYSGPH